MQHLEIDDLIVLLLGAPTSNPALSDRINGITRLEKLIFLVERESSFKELLAESADFEPYNFGPFSQTVYKAVGYLSSYGLITDTGIITSSTDDAWAQHAVIGIERDDPYATRNFILSEAGKRYYRALSEEIPQKLLDELAEFKNEFGSLPTRQLIRYVYRRYPDMTERSLIRDEIIGNG